MHARMSTNYTHAPGSPIVLVTIVIVGFRTRPFDPFVTGEPVIDHVLL